MSGPAPGWQPDPTGRHEYRYWDGTKWSDDVSDAGVTATDPVAGTPDPAQQAPQAAQPDPTQAQPSYQSGGYEPTAVYDSGAGQQGYGTGGYQQAAGPQSGGQPGYTSGGYTSGGQMPTYGAQQRPPSSGPSTGLLVGLGALVVVLVAGIAFVLLGSDDDKDETSTTNPTTTTAGSETTDPVETTAPPVDTTLGGGGSNDAIVSAIAEGILQGSGGVLNEEEATCMAQAMVDQIGVERLIELGLETDPSADPLSVLTPEEQDAVYNAMANCVDPGTLGELGGL